MLLLAPWPESLWAFRRIWDRVSAVGRVVAIDLPGFGHSDGRPELIAPDTSGAFLARLIDEWSLGAPHVVGPDVGTTSRGNKQRRNTAAWSSTGSAAGIGASQRANLSSQVKEQIPPCGITTF